MAWRGGFQKERLNREDWVKYVNSFPKQSWVKFVVLHNSGAPTMVQARDTKHYPPKPGQLFDSRAFDARQGSFENYYKNEEHWNGGPHGFVYEDGKIGRGTPINKQGTHSPNENTKSLGFEMVADFRKGSDDPTKGGGLVIYDTMAFVFATVLKWLDLKPSNTTIRLHKENPSTTHDCPGNLINKADFIKRVQAYYDGKEQHIQPVQVVENPEPTKPGTDVIQPPVIGSPKEIQQRLVVWGYDIGKTGPNKDGVDGDIGPKSIKAIKDFQKKMGVDQSGKVGPWIWKKLSEDPNAPKIVVVEDIKPTVVEETKPDPIVVVDIPQDFVDVRTYQERLTELGYDLGNIDGVKGSKTIAAINKFIADHKLNDTKGIMTESLWKYILVTPLPPKPTDPNLLKGKDRPLYAKKVLMDLGWKDYQAAALVGQFMRESYPDLKTDVWGDYYLDGKRVPNGTAGSTPTSHGIAQWRDPIKNGKIVPDRLTNLRNFMAANNKSMNDLEYQVRFADWELRNTEKAVGNALAKSNDMLEALRAAVGFERPRGYSPTNPENSDGWKERMLFAYSLM